jgi:hypothetical protein
LAKIVHVSSFCRKAKGSFQHGADHKLTNGLIRNGHSVFNFSDRDVARAGPFFGHRKFGIGYANRELVNLCRNIIPDILLLGHADVIRPETIANIREKIPRIRVVQRNVDAMFVPDNVRRIMSRLEVVDATLVSTAGEALAPLARPGKLLGFFPNPVDFSIETGRNHERSDLPHDFFFACGNGRISRNVCGREWNPDDLLHEIETAIPSLRTLTAGMRGKPHAFGAIYQNALESAAVGLNLSRRNDHFLYSSDRIAHMAGNGLAVLVDRATGYDTLFAENEMAFFSSIDELVDQVGRLTSDIAWRRHLAKCGRARYHALFNERIVARYVVEVAFETLKESDYPWPTLFRSDRNDSRQYPIPATTSRASAFQPHGQDPSGCVPARLVETTAA